MVVNLGIYVKAVRGIFSAAYSLLSDCTIYPVINGSAFYLDDFPSPVPGGNGEYIYRDYGINVRDFYANIWWPDILALAEKYGVRYTGVVIENYGDQTDGVIEHQMETSRFQYFGNMLLRHGGEIGYHGYNHQPLALGNVKYGDILPYNTWADTEAMENAMTELLQFCREMYPEASMSVYVPPSNVLSEEGRQLLAAKCPEIRTIASNYFTGEFAYEQEFEVAEDGIVEQPRIISSAVIDDYMQLCAFSELNMHFVNTHFMHSDDLLDEDRGAALLMGINVNGTIALTFAIGSGLAAIAGVLLCSAYPSLTPYTGAMPGIKAFVAAVFGGIGSIPGAFIGGILLGIIEIFGKAYISSQMADAIVFAVLIIVLLVKPTGLLGKKIQEKV